MRMKLRKEAKRIKFGSILTMIIILIFFFSWFFIREFNKKITPRLLEIVEIKLDKLTNSFILQFFSRDILSNEFIGDIILLSKNKNEEIIAVDFDLEKAYQVLADATQRIKSGINSGELGTINHNDYYDPDLSNGVNGLVLSIPMGAASDFIYLANLGPKIPVKISYVGSLYTNLKTKISDYGINNAMIEVSIEVMVTEEIITPVNKKNLDKKYEILIASKIVQGKVPEYYGGVLESRSSIFNAKSNV